MRRAIRKGVLCAVIAAVVTAIPPASLIAQTVPTPALAATPSVEATSVVDATPTVGTTDTPTTPVRLEDDDPRVRFSGRWTCANDMHMSGRSVHWSRTRGAAARIAFEGTGVSLVGVTGPARGFARIYVDGVATATIDLYTSAALAKRVVWSGAGFSAGAHTLKVEVTGSHSSSSSASWVHVDAFDVEGQPASAGALPGVRVQERDKRLYRRGSWSTVTTGSASGGKLLSTTRKGASMTVRFKGTGLTWIGRKGPSGGRSVVYIDGKRYQTVSQYATAAVDGRVVWAVSSLSNRVHSVTLSSMHEASVAGAGTRTDIDAFQVNGKVLTALRPTPFKYPWRTYIVIDKSAFRLYWIKDGMLVKSYPVAHGRPSMPTPARVWRIKAKYHTSGVSGPRKMRLFKQIRTRHGVRYVRTAYGIHGTNQEWVIGTRASHGCIRMYNRDVLELFPQVPMGTMVVTRN